MGPEESGIEEGEVDTRDETGKRRKGRPQFRTIPFVCTNHRFRTRMKSSYIAKLETHSADAI